MTYADLIDRTEKSCRGICRFLNLEFDEKMLTLEGADLSAVFCSAQHEYLRNGKIKRRPSSNHPTNPRTVQKLKRFRNRWNRQRWELLGHHTAQLDGGEPGLLERLYHQFAGSTICRMDAVKRALIEFLPLPWLRTYRQLKAWFLAGRPMARATRLPLHSEFRTNKATIVLSLLVLAVVVMADYLTGTDVSLLPFYMITPAILTLVISQRWGTVAAVISAMAWALEQNVESSLINFSHFEVWLWDLLMRFLALQVVVLLLGRIRVEINSQKTSSD